MLTHTHTDTTGMHVLMRTKNSSPPIVGWALKHNFVPRPKRRTALACISIVSHAQASEAAESPTDSAESATRPTAAEQPPLVSFVFGKTVRGLPQLRGDV